MGPPNRLHTASAWFARIVLFVAVSYRRTMVLRCNPANE
jgi:hypothetical protein